MAWLLVRRGRRCRRSRVAFAIFAIPATVLPLHATASAPAIFLGLALLTLVASGAPHRARRLAGDAQVLVLGTLAVVVAGLVVGTRPGVTKSAFLDWQTLEPARRRGPAGSAWATSGTRTTRRCTGPRRRTQVLAGDHAAADVLEGGDARTLR